MPRVILTFIYFNGNIDIWLPEYTLVASTHTSIAYTMKGRGLGELDNVESELHSRPRGPPGPYRSTI